MLKVDFAANARSLGAHALKADTLDDLKRALKEAKTLDRTTVIVVETDTSTGVPGYESWWDVAVAEVSEMESVREARARYEEARKRERYICEFVLCPPFRQKKGERMGHGVRKRRLH